MSNDNQTAHPSKPETTQKPSTAFAELQTTAQRTTPAYDKPTPKQKD